MSWNWNCCRSSNRAGDLVVGEPAPAVHSNKQKIAGIVLLIITAVCVVLAALFGAGVFDQMLHISKTQLISGSLAIAAALTLLVGVRLAWNPCKPVEKPVERT